MRGDLTIRKVWTVSGATAVQVVQNEEKQRSSLKHIGSAHVVLIPDNDQPGLTGMMDIADQLHGTLKNIRIPELPGLGERKDKHGKDFSDWADIDGNTD